jgi:hypothetical protein
MAAASLRASTTSRIGHPDDGNHRDHLSQRTKPSAESRNGAQYETRAGELACITSPTSLISLTGGSCGPDLPPGGPQQRRPEHVAAHPSRSATSHSQQACVAPLEPSSLLRIVGSRSRIVTSYGPTLDLYGALVKNRDWEFVALVNRANDDG